MVSGRIWNDARLQTVRALQDPPPLAGGAPAETETNGCANCHFFFNQANPAASAYVNFEAWLANPTLSSAQRANLELAKASYEKGHRVTGSMPLRYFLLFGQRCNIDCVMCIQSPGRRREEPELSPQLWRSWWPSFQSALRVDVIGGEPFAIPSALSFIRAFIADAELSPVRLNIFTNATILHKHLSTLQKKDKVGFAVSLDSVGPGYEAIRRGGSWARVEENLLAVQARIAGPRPEWTLTTNALMMKTALPHLPAFARFHVANGLTCVFHAMVSCRGIEENTYGEDYISYPHLLDDMPQWRDCFDEAIAVYDRPGFANERALLLMFRERVEQRLAASPPLGARATGAERISWTATLLVAAFARSTGYNNAPLECGTDGLVRFRPSHNHQAHYLAVSLSPGTLRLRCHWPQSDGGADEVPCSVVLEDQEGLERLSWSEHRTSTGLVKEALLRSRGTGFEVAFKTGRKGSVNLLPARVELSVLGD